MNSNILPLIIFFGLFFISCTQKENTCVIKGKVINRPNSSNLIFIKHFDDIRSNSSVNIPIQEGTFSYEFKYNDIEAYDLVFEDEYNNSSFLAIIFFPINGTVEMELYPRKDAKQNMVLGGEENKQYSDYYKKRYYNPADPLQPIKDSIDVLYKNGLYNNQIVKDLLKKANEHENQEDIIKIYSQINKLEKSGEGLTPVAKKLEKQRDSLNRYLIDKYLKYIKNNMTIHSYMDLITDIINSKYIPEMLDVDRLGVLQKKYAEKFKDHPYTHYSNELLWGIYHVKVGEELYDFTLPDMGGKEYILSDEIKGKYAFIDIWAPWCGPCIAKSRKMKEVFEKYKDKDFTVIAVASKYRDIADVKKILKTDDYPWVTLIDKPELDSRINEHYGIKNSGGITVLVDKEGEIALVNPSVDEVRNFLESNF